MGETEAAFLNVAGVTAALAAELKRGPYAGPSTCLARSGSFLGVNIPDDCAERDLRHAISGSKIIPHLCSDGCGLRCIDLIAEVAELADHSRRALSL